MPPQAIVTRRRQARGHARRRGGKKPPDTGITSRRNAPARVAGRSRRERPPDVDA